MSIACLNGCGKVGTIRGLCRGCHGSLARLVKAGKTTWEQLHKQGRVLPSKRRKPEKL